MVGLIFYIIMVRRHRKEDLKNAEHALEQRKRGEAAERYEYDEEKEDEEDEDGEGGSGYDTRAGPGTSRNGNRRPNVNAKAGYAPAGMSPGDESVQHAIDAKPVSFGAALAEQQ